MATSHFYLERTVEHDDAEYDVNVDISVSSDGIGSYECHGYRGFDRGKRYIDEWEIESVYIGKSRVDFRGLPPNDQDSIIKSIETWIQDGAMELITEMEKE